MTRTTVSESRLDALEFGYLRLMDQHYDVPIPNLNAAQRFALRKIAEKMGANSEAFITLVVTQWSQGVSAAIQRASPDASWRKRTPSLCAVEEQFDEVLRWMGSAGYGNMAIAPSGKARRAALKFNPPLGFGADDEDDENEDGGDPITIGDDASGDEAATA